MADMTGMKAVILCGGQGTRIRDVSEILPKPMLPIGEFPVLWHIMRHYAEQGVRDFLLCVGYKSWQIKEFFLNLRAMTSGKATFEMKFSHYDPIAGKIAEKVIEERNKELEEDSKELYYILTRNTSLRKRRSVSAAGGGGNAIFIISG